MFLRSQKKMINHLFFSQKPILYNVLNIIFCTMQSNKYDEQQIFAVLKRVSVPV